MEEMTPFLLWLVVFAFCLRCANSDLQTASQHPPLPLPCFVSCVCEEQNSSSLMIRCTVGAHFAVRVDDFNRYLLNRSSETTSQTTHVHLKTDSDSLPGFLRRIPLLRFLSVAGNELSLVPNRVLNGMRLRELNLSRNRIRRIEDGALDDLSHLTVLDLSHNKLSSVSKLVFADLPELKLLNLDHNDLTDFPLGAFSHAPRLEVLSVNHNRLSYLPPGSLLGLPSVRRLALRNNSLWSVSVSIREESPTLELLDLTSNPFHCSCRVPGLRELFTASDTNAKTVNTTTSNINTSNTATSNTTPSNTTTSNTNTSNSTSLLLLRPELMRCLTPLSVAGRQVSEVEARLKDCWEPVSVLGRDSRSVLYRDDVSLTCDVQGDPDPALVWVTPWGHQFADPSHWARLDSTVCSSCRRQLRQYSSPGIFFYSTVSVTRGGKSLHITNFRGMFTGNISCRAYNYLGNASTTHQVAMYCGIPGVFVDSLFAGASCAAGFLCFGLLVGSVKMLVLACLPRFLMKRKVTRTRTPTTTAFLSIQDADANQSATEEEEEEEGSQCRSHSIQLSDDFDDTSPGGSPLAVVSALPSPTTPLTPNEGQGTPTGARQPASILETMEEARWRLRHGVGRSVQSVRRNVQSFKRTGQRNVQSIRESGSVYMQNIKESGSTAANKVMAGMAMGMVTVKSRVQSIKEFCGTGDMGSHTISSVSFETNLDTNETTELIKTVTFV